jgi:putative Mg2+ transporter-C (MgtC) family protein
VRNLTTAASLWVVAAIGLSAGVGDIGTAGVTTVLLLASLVALRPLRRALRRARPHDACTLRVRLTVGAGTDPAALVDAVVPAGLDEAKLIALEKEDGRRVVVVSMKGTSQPILRGQQLLVERPDVEDVRVIESSGTSSAVAERED